VRAAAVAAVARLDPQAGAILRTVLADAHPSVRRTAAAAAEVLAADSVQALLGDPDAEVRVAGLEALARRPRPELTPMLLPMLSNRSWHVRRAAADAIGASGRAEAVRPLVRALVDSHPVVRGRALIALERLLGGELDRLLSAALEDAAPSLRRTIVEILGRHGRVEPLLRLADDEDAGVRIALVHALEHASSLQARAAIERLADDPDIAVRNAVAMVGGRGEAGREKSHGRGGSSLADDGNAAE
jgi:HEAT repeat protein